MYLSSSSMYLKSSSPGFSSRMVSPSPIGSLTSSSCVIESLSSRDSLILEVKLAMGTLASTRLLKNSAYVSPSKSAVMLTSESDYGPAVSPGCKNRAILPPATIFTSSRCSMTGISPRPKGNSSSSLLVSSAPRGARADASIFSCFRDGKCLKRRLQATRETPCTYPENCCASSFHPLRIEKCASLGCR